MCSILHFHMLLLLFSEGTECVCYVATIITDTPRQYYEYSGKSLKVQQFYQYKDLLIKGRTWDVCLCQSEVQDVPLSKSTFQCFVQMDVARLWSKLSNLFWNWNISERNEISILEKSCTEKSNLKLLWGKDSFIGKKQDSLENRKKVTRRKLWKKVVLSSLTWHGHFPGSHW